MHGTSATLPLPSARSSVEARSEVVIYLPLWLAHQEREDAEAEPFLTSRGELLAGDEEIIQMPLSLSLPNADPFTLSPSFVSAVSTFGRSARFSPLPL